MRSEFMTPATVSSLVGQMVGRRDAARAAGTAQDNDDLYTDLRDVLMQELSRIGKEVRSGLQLCILKDYVDIT